MAYFLHRAAAYRARVPVDVQVGGVMTNRKPLSPRRRAEFRGRYLKRALGIDRKGRAERWAWLRETMSHEMAVEASAGKVWVDE